MTQGRGDGKNSIEANVGALIGTLRPNGSEETLEIARRVVLSFLCSAEVKQTERLVNAALLALLAIISNMIFYPASHALSPFSPNGRIFTRLLLLCWELLARW